MRDIHAPHPPTVDCAWPWWLRCRSGRCCRRASSSNSGGRGSRVLGSAADCDRAQGRRADRAHHHAPTTADRDRRRLARQSAGPQPGGPFGGRLLGGLAPSFISASLFQICSVTGRWIGQLASMFAAFANRDRRGRGAADLELVAAARPAGLCRRAIAQREASRRRRQPVGLGGLGGLAVLAAERRPERRPATRRCKPSPRTSTRSSG